MKRDLFEENVSFIEYLYLGKNSFFHDSFWIFLVCEYIYIYIYIHISFLNHIAFSPPNFHSSFLFFFILILYFWKNQSPKYHQPDPATSFSVGLFKLIYLMYMIHLETIFHKLLFLMSISSVLVPYCRDYFLAFKTPTPYPVPMLYPHFSLTFLSTNLFTSFLILLLDKYMGELKKIAIFKVI